MKGIIIFITMCLLIRCGHEGNADIDFANKEANRKKELVLFCNKSFNKEILSSGIYIIDSLEADKFIIPLNFEYAHSKWINIAIRLLMYDMTLNSMTDKIRVNSNGVFYFGFKFIRQVRDDSKELGAVYQVEGIKPNYLDFKNIPHLESFFRYVIDEMTPSDFQAYDWAFEVLYEQTKDPRFKKTFYEFLIEMAHHPMITTDDDYILKQLIVWAKSRSDVEKTDHFDFFKNELKDSTIIIDLGADWKTI